MIDMIYLRNTRDFSFENTAVTIGKFDALHKGHRALIERLLQCKDEGLKTVVMSLDFEPDAFAGHGAMTEECGGRDEIAEECGGRDGIAEECGGHDGIAEECGGRGAITEEDGGRNGESRSLRSEAERMKILKEMGVDIFISYPFTKEDAKMEPTAFIDDMIIGKLGAKTVVAGNDFCFGKNREGNTWLLQTYGSRHGYKTITLKRIEYEDEPISSSRIRQALADGKIEEAEQMM